MKRKLILIFFLGICTFGTGCGENSRIIKMTDEYGYIDDSEDNADDKNVDDYEEGEEKEVVDMTTEQMELLCRISVDEESVREGKLHKWQIEVLNQYDYAMDYLTRKYPSYSFYIETCEPKSKLNSYTTFYFYKADETDMQNRFELYMDVYEDAEIENRYVARDNFYGDLIEDEYAEKMHELLKESFPECIKVICNIPYVQGEEFGENLDLDLVLAGELEMAQDMDFYIDADKINEKEYSKEVTKLKEFVDGKGIKGCYGVRFISKANAEEVIYEEYFFGNRGEKRWQNN